MERKPWPCIECRVMMIKINNDYCKCPVCGTEVWYNYNSPTGDEIAELMQDRAIAHQPKEIPPAGEPLPGGGSKSRSKKDKSKKDSLATLNQKLYIET